jgi:diguanylate cyclase (GGDEF)-like protein
MHQIREAVLTCLNQVEDDEELFGELNHIAGRYGGEALLLVLPETSKQNATIIGERIRASVEEMTFNWEGRTIKLTLSGGIASYSEETPDVLTLVGEADHAVYMAKKQGKNRIL